MLFLDVTIRWQDRLVVHIPGYPVKNVDGLIAYALNFSDQCNAKAFAMDADTTVEIPWTSCPVREKDLLVIASLFRSIAEQLHGLGRLGGGIEEYEDYIAKWTIRNDYRDDENSAQRGRWLKLVK